MIDRLLNRLFGCSHKHYTRPFTPTKGARRPKAAILTGTYVCCLECGREIPYDLNRMKFAKRSTRATVIPSADVTHSNPKGRLA